MATGSEVDEIYEGEMPTTEYNGLKKSDVFLIIIIVCSVLLGIMIIMIILAAFGVFGENGNKITIDFDIDFDWWKTETR